MRTASFACIILALTVASTFSQENVSVAENITQSIETTTQYVLPIDLSSIFQIKFDLKDEELNLVAAQLIYNATEVNITVSDLVELTQAENLNLTAIDQVLDALDLSSPDLFNFDSLESAFTELNISVLNIYRKLVGGFIPQPKDDVPRLLDTFDINQVSFNNVVLYGNDTEFFEILKSANFSEQNVKEAFDFLQKTPADLYDYVKPNLFPRIREYSMDRLLDIVKRSGLTPKHFKDVLDIFQLKRERYEAVPSFRNAFTEFVNEINSVELYGTLVNSSVLATVNMVFNKYKHFKRVADAYVENLSTPRTTYKVSDIDAYSDDCLYGPVLVKFEGSSTGRVLEIAQDYNEYHPQDCRYFVVVDDVLIEEKPHVHYSQHNLIAHISENTTFKVGSPLVCKNLLYGIAEEAHKDQIGFRSFHCDVSVPDTTTILSDEISGVSRSFIKMPAVMLMLVVFVFVQ